MNDLIHLHNDAGDHASISLYGGQVLTWQTGAGIDHLYLSPKAVAGNGKAIRAGIPVCFPQFASWGNLLKHGFARCATWRQNGPALSGLVPAASVQLVLEDSAEMRTMWPYPFRATLDVTLSSGMLELVLGVHNTGTGPFEFTAALHTYLACSDVRTLTLHGLEDTAYLDATNGNTPVAAALAPVKVTAEIDRIYEDAPAALELLQDGQPFLSLRQQGFADTVVWNPGAEKAAALDDMPDQDWQRMFCIEAAQILHAVHLEPGAIWRGSQRLCSAVA